MTYKRSVVWLFGLLTIYQTVAAEEIMLLTEQLPPLQYEDSDGQLQGLMVDRVKLLLKEADIDTEILVMPWARAYEMTLSRPNTLLFSMLRNEPREEQFIWVAKLGISPTYLYRNSANTSLSLTTLADIEKEIIGVKRNDISANFLQRQLPNGQFITQTNTIDNIRMLAAKRIDLVPTNRHQLTFFCQELGCDTNDFEPTIKLVEIEQMMYLAANTQTDKAIIDKLVNAAKKLRVHEVGSDFGY
ncbi:MAG: transporter substrate-binding domain-containing protein [Alteromonadaceae bacterium]|nr:transporter substrate-binding domain-containing protein [Alteromonadaceae bacterium]